MDIIINMGEVIISVGKVIVSVEIIISLGEVIINNLCNSTNMGIIINMGTINSYINIWIFPIIEGPLNR